MIKDIYKKFRENRFVTALVDKLQKVSLPGFKGRSIYDVSKFFIRSLFDEDLTLRASSIAFNFFIALFPLIIFLFTLIPYIPIADLQGYLLDQVEQLMPEIAYTSMITTIEEIVLKQNTGLLSFGFIAAIYFSSNGFASMMTAFNKYTDRPMKRSWISERIRSIGMVFLVSVILILTISLVAYLNLSIHWLSSKDLLTQKIFDYLLSFIQYISLFALIYFIFSTLYYYGSSRIHEWRFFSPGSTLATILSVLATIAFSYYVNNFNSYNKLYGSIGTILVVMLLIYFNCIILLVGFELNSSIDLAEERQEEISEQDQ